LCLYLALRYCCVTRQKEESRISGKKGASDSDSKRLTIHISSDLYDIVVPSVALLSDDQ